MLICILKWLFVLGTFNISNRLYLTLVFSMKLAVCFKVSDTGSWEPLLLIKVTTAILDVGQLDFRYSFERGKVKDHIIKKLVKQFLKKRLTGKCGQMTDTNQWQKVKWSCIWKNMDMHSKNGLNLPKHWIQ